MIAIREMREADRGAVLRMMRVFYASDAVNTSGSDEIFNADIDACVGESSFAEGFVFEEGADNSAGAGSAGADSSSGAGADNTGADNASVAGGGSAEIAGYAMVAKSFSTEFGKPCIWIEDIYLTPEHRGRGAAGTFFAFLETRFPDAIFRLEVEHDNAPAMRAYRKNGFSLMPYAEMIKGVTLDGAQNAVK